jgi:hypothetical protein
MVQAQDAGDAPKQELVDRLPPEYTGRWATIAIDDEREVPRLGDCRRDGATSASLIVGPNWTLSPSNGTQFLSIYNLGESDGYKIEVADNAGGGLAVSLELFKLSPDGNRLEIASRPEIGWDVALYARCPPGEY